MAALKLVSGLLVSSLAFESNFSLYPPWHNLTVHVRIEGGIPPLVELLEYSDVKVQRAAAGALRTLAFKNDENKTQVDEFLSAACYVLAFSNTAIDMSCKFADCRMQCSTNPYTNALVWGCHYTLWSGWPWSIISYFILYTFGIRYCTLPCFRQFLIFLETVRLV